MPKPDISKVIPSLAQQALKLADGDRKVAYSNYIKLYFSQTGRLAPGCDNRDLQAFYDSLEVDTIEAMRKHIEALQAENEQLQAQVARMREALEYYADIKRWSEVNLIYVPSPDKARKALSSTSAAYHNPADVEALKKAREALDDSLQYIDEACIHESLAEIDKAIGGKEDV